MLRLIVRTHRSHEMSSASLKAVSFKAIYEMGFTFHVLLQVSASRLPKPLPMLLQYAMIHDHKDARLTRLGRSYFVDDTLLEP